MKALWTRCRALDIPLAGVVPTGSYSDTERVFAKTLTAQAPRYLKMRTKIISHKVDVVQEAGAQLQDFNVAYQLLNTAK